MAVMTLEDLKSGYGMDIPEVQKARWQTLLDTAEEACLSYAGIECGEVEEHFESPNRILVLTHSPVLSVTSVRSQGAELAYRYEKRSETVILSTDPPGEAVVSYRCGWEEGKAPSALMSAVAFTVMHLSKLSASRLLGVTSRTTDGGTEQVEQSVPPLAAQRLLEGYRHNRMM